MRLSPRVCQSLRQPWPKTPLPLWETLKSEHKQFTDGSSFWRDNYLLRYWYTSQQPVVYHSNVYNGYKLICRLGDWCWLTRDPISRRYLTVKFLHRASPRGDADLRIHKYLQKYPEIPHVARMFDAFEIPHHLAARGGEYSNISFQALVYPATGADLRRLLEPNFRDSVLPLNDWIQCIRDVVRGLSALHNMGIVHGDIHPGNICLPLPSEDDMDEILAKPPEEDRIIRKDGQPTDLRLPDRVVQPVTIGFDRGPATILDFGYAFLEGDAESYTIEAFGDSAFAPPELLGKSASTTLPFKVDSWSLGRLIYFILCSGDNFIDDRRWLSDRQPQHIDEQIANLENGKSETWENTELPAEIKSNFKRILLSLFRKDPSERLAVTDLVRDEWLMGSAGDWMPSLGQTRDQQFQ